MHSAPASGDFDRHMSSPTSPVRHGGTHRPEGPGLEARPQGLRPTERRARRLGRGAPGHPPPSFAVETWRSVRMLVRCGPCRCLPKARRGAIVRRWTLWGSGTQGEGQGQLPQGRAKATAQWEVRHHSAGRRCQRGPDLNRHVVRPPPGDKRGSCPFRTAIGAMIPDSGPASRSPQGCRKQNHDLSSRNPFHHWMISCRWPVRTD